MGRTHCFLAFILFVAGTLLGADAAFAQLKQTFVSGVGNDAQTCARNAPCKTFAGALGKTAAGGEIVCITPGDFGKLAIAKSITIDCSAVKAGVQAFNTQGIEVNAAATDVVVLRGVDIDGSSADAGLNGIRFLSGAALRVDDCTIRNFVASSSGLNGVGILFRPTTTAKLYVSDSRIYGNTNSTSTGGGDGIFVVPQGSASAKAMISNSIIDSNGIGITVSGTGTTGNVSASISDSSISDNKTGFSTAGDGSGQVNVALTRVIIAHNNFGIQVSNQTTVRLGYSVLTGNNTGITGSVQTYRNNQLAGNGALGTLTPINLQ